ncbi:helix-turn-helix domain-containing protein [Streptomyces sp. NPDC002553]|uniref:helix-turn-helix domain-containing protein n=1 Tax=Streptomyces sp. NPDC002553 TaxID=3154417 RepID=UPI00332C6177
MSEPVLAFVLRLRELYEESGWSSLRAFAEAVGYSRGTISRFLSGERQPKAYFLDKLFAAMEDRTGRPVAEAVRAETRRLYFESVRLKAPAEYQVFRMEEELGAAHDETRQRLDEQLKAHDTDRHALTGRIAELTDNLRHMEQERQELLRRSEHLAGQARVEGERRKFLGQVLEEVVRLQDGPALALTPPQQPSDRWPLTGLVLGDRTGKVDEIALSPDGALIASVGSEGTLRFWEPAASRSPVRTLHHDRQVLALDFHAGRRLLATACQDGSVWLWKPATGRSAEPERLEPGITDVRAVAFAPRGDGLLAIAGLGGRAVELWKPDRDGTTPGSPSRRVRFLRDESGRPPPPGTRVGRFSGYRLYEGFGGHAYGVNALAFSPAGGLLATAGVDGTIKLWDLAVGTPAAGPLSGHEGPVRAIAFSPDGRRLASGGADGTVRLWDPVAASPTGRPLTGHTGAVGCVAFSPDGQLVASAGDDATVRCWSPVAGRPLGEPLTGHHGPVTGLSFAPNGGLLSTTGTDRTVRLWPIPSV